LAHLTTGKQHTALSDHGIVTVREVADETIGVGLDACFLDELELFVVAELFERGADQTVFNVASDSGREQSRLLGYET
jgi:hypothetical protein